ncbi:hypothetical protein M9Y10_023629 [Tritrichomonas musculus]|uniref:DNA topoisomerase 2 n=1 Tax=Tritrichomonas musculus TaxID=1915356 RepID=A0ABR2KXJ8_9EUKA
MSLSRGKTVEKMKISFLPDPEIFQTTREFKYSILAKRLCELAFLNPGVRIEQSDERIDKEEIYKFDDGIREFVTFLNKGKTPLHDNVFFIDGSVAPDPSKPDSEHVFALAYSIYKIEGGTHLSCFRTALTRVLNAYAKANNLLKGKDPMLTGDDVRERLTAVVSVKVPEPRFEGQTKTKLSSGEVDGIN